jgi:hypothetical protein
MKIAIAAGELNNLFMMVGDISSAYLEAFTLEKVCFIAGPEFGPLAGHPLTIVRALYGLRTSGARWHDCFADVMHLMGFHLSRQLRMCGCITALLTMNLLLSMLITLC